MIRVSRFLVNVANGSSGDIEPSSHTRLTLATTLRTVFSPGLPPDLSRSTAAIFTYMHNICSIVGMIFAISSFLSCICPHRPFHCSRHAIHPHSHAFISRPSRLSTVHAINAETSLTNLYSKRKHYDPHPPIDIWPRVRWLSGWVVWGLFRQDLQDWGSDTREGAEPRRFL